MPDHILCAFAEFDPVVYGVFCFFQTKVVMANLSKAQAVGKFRRWLTLPWFHGPIGRDEAEARLQRVGCTNGSCGCVERCLILV